MIFLTSVTENINTESELDELIARIAKGDTDAFAAFYERTKASVYGFSLSILRNRHDAEDVMQNCYIAVFNAAAGYKSNKKPMAWVLTITKNLCYQLFREKSKTHDFPMEALNDILFSDEFSSQSDSRIVLEYCLRELSETERQIVLLHAVSGLKHKDTARLLELPLGTVLSKYNRAIAKIKEHFKGDEEND